MNYNRLHLYAVLTLVLSIFSALMLNHPGRHTSALSGLLVIGVLFSSRLCFKESRKTGKTSNTRIMLVLLPPIYESILIFGAVLSPIIPPYLKALSIAAVLMTYTVRNGFIKELRETVQPVIGHEARLVMLSIGFILYSVNVYFLFYGLAALTAASLYDIVSMTYRKTDF